MRTKQNLSLLITLIVFLSTISFPLTGQAQPPDRFRAGTGVVVLGLGQILRLTVNGQDGADAFRVRFAWVRYMPAGCNSEGVCRHAVQSQGVTTPITLSNNQAASFEIAGTGGPVSLGVRVSTADVIGDAEIINVSTGEVTSHVIMANTEGD